MEYLRQNRKWIVDPMTMSRMDIMTEDVMRKAELYDMIYSVCDDCIDKTDTCPCDDNGIYCPLKSLMDKLEDRFRK